MQKFYFIFALSTILANFSILAQVVHTTITPSGKNKNAVVGIQVNTPAGYQTVTIQTCFSSNIKIKNAAMQDGVTITQNGQTVTTTFNAPQRVNNQTFVFNVKLKCKKGDAITVQSCITNISPNAGIECFCQSCDAPTGQSCELGCCDTTTIGCPVNNSKKC